MPVKRRQYLNKMGAAAVTGLTGGYVGSTTISRKNQGKPEKTEVRYLGTYFPDAVYGAMHAAQEKGFFDQVGLTVKSDFTLNIQNILQVLLAGKYDVVNHTPIGFLLARAKGIPIYNLGVSRGKPMTSFFSKAKADIESMEDWPGHTLGLQNENDRLWFTHEMYQKVGLSEKQIKNIDQVFTGYSIKNLMTGKVDILSGYPTNSDFNSLRLAGQDFNVQYSSDYLDVPGNNLIMPQEYVEKYPNTAREFYRAYAKGVEYAYLDKSNQREMAELTVQKLKEANANVFLGEVDPVKVEMSNYKMLYRFTPADHWEKKGIGWADPSRWNNLQQIGREMGDLSRELNLNKILDNKFVKAVTNENGDLIWPPE